MPDLLSFLLYEACHYFGTSVGILGFSLRTESRRHMPLTGPVLLLANHQSFLDPVLVGMAARRHIRYLARKSLFEHPRFATLIRSLGAVPVDQSGMAKEGLRTVLDLLEAGQAVVVFPEGERTATGQMQPFRPGVHLLVKKSRATVVPVGIAGAFDVLPRHRKLPRFSPLFLPPTGADIAVAVGPPVAGEQLAHLGRADMLDELFRRVAATQERAERLRRKR